MIKVSKKDVDTIRNSSLFDAAWYVENYPDVKILSIDPAEHYLKYGARLNRDPSSEFSSKNYQLANRDIQRGEINPLLHYERVGRKEGRPLAPLNSSAYLKPATKCKRVLERRRSNWDQALERQFVAELAAYQGANAATKVSIIMPTRNRSDVIGTAIQSILRQTHQNWELIVIDDGGSDNTEEILSSYNDKRITYVKQDFNVGVSAARNIGLKYSLGKWIFFLDSDNSWREEHISNMLAFAERNRVSAAYCAASLIDDNGRQRSVLYADFDFESCLIENFIDLNSFCVRGNWAKIGFDTSLRRLVDWDYILRIAARTRVMGAPFIGVDYYDGDGHSRISRNEYRDQQTLLEMINKIRSNARCALIDADRSLIKDRIDSIAIVFHIYHPDVVDECIQYLRNIPIPFDLYVTTSLSMDEEAIQKVKGFKSDSIILRYPNIGSDIATFIELNSTLVNYDLVGKIHTKRNVKHWGPLWRRYMLHSIMGTKEICSQVIDMFNNNRKLVMLGPAEFFKSGEINSLPETMEQVIRLAGKTDMVEALKDNWGFFAGSVFWLRPAILIKMARYLCDNASYSPDFHRDGAPEHGIERLLGVAALEMKNAQIGLSSIQHGGDVGITCTIPKEGHTPDGISATLDKLVAQFGTDLSFSAVTR